MHLYKRNLILFLHLSSTKGMGRVAPKKWQDAGDALDNAVLKGCHMPAGPGEDCSAEIGNGHLQYNEVCRSF
jgi:poly [ADP-ribose] polymerase